MYLPKETECSPTLNKKEPFNTHTEFFLKTLSKNELENNNYNIIYNHVKVQNNNVFSNIIKLMNEKRVDDNLILQYEMGSCNLSQHIKDKSSLITLKDKLMIL